jgi:hypothetical protein
MDGEICAWCGREIEPYDISWVHCGPVHHKCVELAEKDADEEFNSYDPEYSEQ